MGSCAGRGDDLRRAEFAQTLRPIAGTASSGRINAQTAIIASNCNSGSAKSASWQSASLHLAHFEWGQSGVSQLLLQCLCIAR
jgi:hypothetical protein